MTVHWGRIGTRGQSQSVGLQEALRRERDKKRKGYEQVKSRTTPMASRLGLERTTALKRLVRERIANTPPAAEKVSPKPTGHQVHRRRVIEVGKKGRS